MRLTLLYIGRSSSRCGRPEHSKRVPMESIECVPNSLDRVRPAHFSKIRAQVQGALSAGGSRLFCRYRCRRRRSTGGHRCRDLQREMGHEGRRGGGGQDQSSAALAFSLFFGVRRLDAALPSSLVKNRTAEGPTLSKPKTKGWGTRGSPGGSICAPPVASFPSI